MDNNNTDQLEVQNPNNEESSTSFVVSTLEDENDGNFSEEDLSLREAIAIANEQEGKDTITFNSNLDDSTIALNSSLERNLNINDDLSILGLGQDNLTLDGGFVFNVSSDTKALIDGLNFKGGTVDNSGDLTFSNSTIRETLNINGSSDYYAIISREGNTNIVGSTIADNNGGSNVGIVIESGTATIKNSAITGNDATAYAQAGVIIRPDATVDISNSTIAENRGRSNGGIENAGTVNVANSTIANNTGGLAAGGIINSADGKATVTSSILTNNTGSANIGDVSGAGEYISGGNNLISNGDDATGFVNGVNGDLVGSNGNDPFNPQTELLIDPQLGELQNNGGLTETLALREESPAIDAGSNPNNLATDQRGEGFERTVGQGTDIGAYEVQTNGSGEIPELIVSTLADENDGDFSGGDLSLREAIALANSGNTITFDSSLSEGTITLSQGELLIDQSLNIDGLDSGITVDANQQSRVFNIDDGNDQTNLDVSLDGLTISGGSANRQTSPGDTNPSNFGGGISNRENLNLNNSQVTGNDAVAGGGGILNAAGMLTIENSTISDNSSNSGRVGAPGGGILNESGELTINNSTISQNSAFQSGAIATRGETSINNSTISDNQATVFAGGISGSADITSSIVADNSNNNNTGTNNLSGEFTSGGNNLIADGDGATGFTNGKNGDIVGTTENPIDPQLGELQDNGGATLTQELLAESPAIDAGSNPNNLATDQRGEGFDRTVGDGTDIGAYEVQTIINNMDIVGTNNRDILRGTPSGDRIFGLDGDDFIQGLDGNDSIDGGNGSDRILSGSGINTIIDGAGDDILLGGADGDIFLAANAGNDLFRGDTGNDIYVYDLNDNGLFDRDRIIDFEQREDKIAFRTLVNDPQSLDNFADLDTDGSGVLDELDDRIQISNSSTVIDFSDIFGRDQGSDTITLIGVTNLDSDNFLFGEANLGTEFG